MIRFLSVPLQTLLAPIITSSLFLFIFGVNMGDRISVVEGFTYVQFVIPGLVLMGVINTSFTNSSSSLFLSRYLNNIVDILVTPIGPAQFILAYTLAAIARGLLVGISVLGLSCFFSDLPWAHPFLALTMAVLSAFMLSQLGIIAAITSDSFEVISMYTNFLLLPLVYLGGMFYPLTILPPVWQTASKFNPLFYTIDGFRHALLGTGDVPLATAFTVTALIAGGLFALAAYLIGKGYGLRT